MKPVICLAVLGAALLSGCASVQEAAAPAVQQAPSGKQVLVPGNALYSAAVAHGETIYLAGVIGRSETGDLSEATRQAMDAVKTNLVKAGGAMDDLVKCTIFMTDIAQYGPVNEVYATYFERDPPARTAIAVSALPFGALVEVECFAGR